MKRLTACLLAVLVLALSACGDKGEPNPAPASTPTPTATGMPDPTTDARETFERYSAELTRILQAGGSDELGPVLAETTADEHQATVLQFLRTVKERRIKSVGHQKITIADTVVESPERVRLYTCEDTTEARWVDESGHEVTLDSATLFETESVLSQVDSHWRIVHAETTRIEHVSHSQQCQDAS